jgi:predicted ArsR family transcriptional regulator
MEQREVSIEVPIDVEQKPERLSDERMGNLISALHTEQNCTTLLAMKPRVFHSWSDLNRVVLQAQGENIGWAIKKGAAFRYCRNSLVPIGLVAREAIDANLNAFRFIKTDYGERVGDPLAGLLLDWSRRYTNASLYRIFGSTHSSSTPREIELRPETIAYKNRSPVLRRKIFRELVTSELPIREADLAQKIGENPFKISQHLISLQRYNVVTYDARKTDQPYTSYKASSNRPEHAPSSYRRDSALTQKVYQIFLSDLEKRWTAKDIVDRIIQEEPEKEENRKELIDRISKVAFRLQRNGYLERGKFSGEVQSEIKLTEVQRESLVDLVNTLDAFQNQDPQILQRGRQLAAYFVAHPQDLSRLMLKAKEHSSHANPTSTAETEEHILSIVGKYPDYVASRIRDVLDEEYDKSISEHRVREFLKHLKQQERIVGTKEKTTIKWRIKS